jgi:hypothetical protein
MVPWQCACHGVSFKYRYRVLLGCWPNSLGLRGKVEVYVVTVHIADAVLEDNGADAEEGRSRNRGRVRVGVGGARGVRG